MIPERIILHHSLTKDSGTVSWGAIRRYHTQTNHWKDIGYHFGVELIGDDYEVLVGRMMTAQGAHTSGENHDSLGICFVGNFDIVTVPEKQWSLGIKLVTSLVDVFDIHSGDIRGHRDFCHKTCPGNFFDVEKFVDEVFGTGRQAGDQ